MSGRTKLKDIASALNVSVATVSRAINDKSDIHPTTKDAILEMAKKLNYKPNNLAVSLRKSHTLNVIGVAIPLVKHYFFSTLLQGIMTQAHESNYFVILGESMHDPDKEEQILSGFLEFGVSGIMLAPSKHSDFNKNVLPIVHRRIPVVIMDRMYDNYSGNYVNTNDFNGAYNATSHLIQCGYQRIAHIGSSDSWSIGHERFQGYKAALRDHGRNLNENLIHICNFNNKEEGAEEGYKASKRLFALKTPPDAIFSVTDDIAIGVYDYAKEHGINIPNDLGIVGFSNSEISNYLNPRLTTMEQNAELMGSTAFQFFLDALSTKDSVFQKTFEPQLILRESTISKL